MSNVQRTRESKLSCRKLPFQLGVISILVFLSATSCAAESEGIDSEVAVDSSGTKSPASVDTSEQEDVDSQDTEMEDSESSHIWISGDLDCVSETSPAHLFWPTGEVKQGRFAFTGPESDSSFIVLDVGEGLNPTFDSTFDWSLGEWSGLPGATSAGLGVSECEFKEISSEPIDLLVGDFECSDIDADDSYVLVRPNQAEPVFLAWKPSNGPRFVMASLDAGAGTVVASGIDSGRIVETVDLDFEFANAENGDLEMVGELTYENERDEICEGEWDPSN